MNFIFTKNITEILKGVLIKLNTLDNFDYVITHSIEKTNPRSPPYIYNIE
jgi:hypothetical protein